MYASTGNSGTDTEARGLEFKTRQSYTVRPSPIQKQKVGWRDGSATKAVDALPEVPDTVPSNHLVAPNHLQLQF